MRHQVNAICLILVAAAALASKRSEIMPRSKGIYTRYSPEKKAEIVEYSKSHSYAATIREYGIARQTLNDWRRRAGLTKPGVRKLDECFWFNPNARLNDALICLLQNGGKRREEST